GSIDLEILKRRENRDDFKDSIALRAGRMLQENFKKFAIGNRGDMLIRHQCELNKFRRVASNPSRELGYNQGTGDIQSDIRRRGPGESRETRIRQIEVCAPRSVRGRGSSEGDGRLAGQNEGPRETRLPPGAVRRGKQPLSSAVVAAADAPTTCACRARRLSSSSSSPSSSLPSTSSMVAPLPTGSPDILDEGCGVMGNWSCRNRLALSENEVKSNSLEICAGAIQVHCENQFDWKSMNVESTSQSLPCLSKAKEVICRNVLLR
ncbi:hypothetical protein ALC60_01119, partial [Trachymyrmex zeteki]